MKPTCNTCKWFVTKIVNHHKIPLCKNPYSVNYNMAMNINDTCSQYDKRITELHKPEIKTRLQSNAKENFQELDNLF